MWTGEDSFGNRYYENLNGEEEVPGELLGWRGMWGCQSVKIGIALMLSLITLRLGRHRWVDIAQVRLV